MTGEDWIKPEVEDIGDGIETNLGSIVRMVFSKLPAIPFSYRLGLDHPVPKGVDPVQHHREILTVLFVQGVRYLYGDIPLNQISSEMMETITAYMASFGYVPKINSDNRLEFEPYQYRR